MFSFSAVSSHEGIGVGVFLACARITQFRIFRPMAVVGRSYANFTLNLVYDDDS